MRKILFITLGILALLVVFFPWLASTPFGLPIFTGILSVKFQAEVSIEKMQLSWFGPQSIEGVTLRKPDLVAFITHVKSDVPFWRLSDFGSSFTLDNGNFSFLNYEDSQITNIQAKIEGKKFEAKGSTPMGGLLAMHGTIISNRNFDLLVSIKEIPTIALDKWLKFNGALYQILGSTLNLNGSISLQSRIGKLSFDFSSPQGSGILNGNINDDTLTLKEPIKASLRLSQGLNDLLVHQNQELLRKINAKNPMMLVISPVGFSCPINPFRFDKIQIQEGTLNLNQVQIEGGDSFQSLVTLFNHKAFEKTTDIWFTPAMFSLQNGLLKLSRVDALISKSIHLCTWGDIDIRNDDLQMTLGLPADTLQESFNIHNLSRTYVLKIPIRGSIQNPQFETKGAIAKIAIMSTSKHIPSKGGKVFGGIVNAITQAQDDGDAPPPNRPFPWER
jgi:hypothetical protein